MRVSHAYEKAVKFGPSFLTWSGMQWLLDGEQTQIERLEGVVIVTQTKAEAKALSQAATSMVLKLSHRGY